MCGGHSNAKEITPEVTEMVNSVRGQIETQLNSTFEVFEPVSYTTQVVAGTNFTVKIRVGDGVFVSVKIFRPLPCNGTELEVTGAAHVFE